MSLVTLNDTKDYLGIALIDATYDVFLQTQIDMLSETILNYCNRVFEQTTVTETIYQDDYPDNIEHYLYYHPVISITSVTEKQPNSVDVVQTSFRINKRTGRLEMQDDCGSKARLFQDYFIGASLEIVYEAGYATVPLEIQEAVFGLIQVRYNRFTSGVPLDFGNNVQRIGIPGVMNLDFDYTLNSNERKNKYGMILQDYLNIFDNYRSERTMVGENSNIYLG